MKSSSCNTTRVPALLLLFLLGGCETLQFYQQAVWGQWQLLRARTPLEQIGADREVAPEVRERVALAQRILAFGRQSLELPLDGRYTSYVQLDREYVVWNVFAAPPFALDGKQWCYPIVGCAPYRGYFSETAARKVDKPFPGEDHNQSLA